MGEAFIQRPVAWLPMIRLRLWSLLRPLSMPSMNSPRLLRKAVMSSLLPVRNCQPGATLNFAM
ncbi:hypothetical protein D9M73_207290 [compost metagenome]